MKSSHPYVLHYYITHNSSPLFTLKLSTTRPSLLRKSVTSMNRNPSARTWVTVHPNVSEGATGQYTDSTLNDWLSMAAPGPGSESSIVGDGGD